MRHNAKPVTLRGVRYRSKFEASLAEALTHHGVLHYYETVRVPYTTEHLYTPDFDVMLPGMRGFYVEAKGYFTAADRQKLLDVRDGNPGLDLRLVFQNASQRLSRATRSLTYGGWAQRNNFKWADKIIPLEWLTDGSTRENQC